MNIDRLPEDSQAIEIPMIGGRTKVWRKGQVVLRETGSWASTVHALLNHLEQVEFAGAPRVVGSGFDDQGRELLTYIEGEFVHPGPWDEASLFKIGQLMRDLHRATASFVIPADAQWREWHGRRLGDPSRGIGHCDTGPWNIVLKNDLSCALIDWEAAGPCDPITGLAQCCWLNAQLHDDDVAERQGLGTLAERATHLRCILDGYELPRSERVGFVEKMIEFAIHDAATEAIIAKVTMETTDVGALWAITWRTRSASWMQRHKAILENVIL